MSWWEKLVYQLSLSFWRAYFEMLLASKEAEEERPSEIDLDRRTRFRNAVQRMLAEGDSRSIHSAPGGEGRQGDNLGQDVGGKTRPAEGKGERGVVDRFTDSG